MSPAITAAAGAGFIGFIVEAYRSAPQSMRQSNFFAASLVSLGMFIGRVLW